MPKLKTLSGEEVIKIFLSFGFNMAAQKGSHIKLARVQKYLGNVKHCQKILQGPDPCQLKNYEYLAKNEFVISP